MIGYISPYGKDRVFLYDDLDAFRDAVKSHAENLSPEDAAYAWGMVDAIGFLMVNHPKTFTRAEAMGSLAGAAQLGEVLLSVLNYRESVDNDE